MIYTPKCPHCNTDLTCSGVFYGGMDEDYVYYDFEGYCPDCLTEFEWDEVFKMVKTHAPVKMREPKI